MNYMKLKNLIAPSQHGFVPNKACVTNLLEHYTDAVIKRHSVVLLVIDFAKTFDKVTHAKLI